MFARGLLYLLIFLSGAAGLIYQTTWQRYLAILLGAHASATSMVLAIFFGGLAAGYWSYGQRCCRPGSTPLSLFLEAELGIAGWALLFSPLFQLFSLALGRLSTTSPVGNALIDGTASLLLIGPPCFFMGGTLPTLTQALSPGLSEASRVHGKIYGWNTLGACVGAFLCGYVLIPWLGLRPPIYLAAVINLIVVAGVWALQNRVQTLPTNESGGTEPVHKGTTPRSLLPVLLTIGFLSGFSTVTLETILIRLVGLSTGATQYSFTIIVGVFILALGLSNVVVRRMPQKTPAHLYWNQLLLALALLGLYLTGDSWPYGVHVLRVLIASIPQSIYLYQVLLLVGFSALLLLPIGLAGLTVPYCFHLLKSDKARLGQHVGLLYAINTIGCVSGALLGGFLVLYWFNIDVAFRLCILLAALGAVLLTLTGAVGRSRLLFSAKAVLATLVGSLVLFTPGFRTERFNQPFRRQGVTSATFQGPESFSRLLSNGSTPLFYKDDPTSTISVLGFDNQAGREISRAIYVNGKCDGNTQGDFFTTLTLAHIPSLLARNLRRVAQIGFGTGSSAGEFTLYRDVSEVHIVEISRTLIQNASLFDAYNHQLSKSPKVHFHQMDGMRFMRHPGEPFDVIMSEPSNPWMSGIENLYSVEFYEALKDRLAVDGIFVQWLHSYSMNEDTLRSIFATVGTVFPHVRVFRLNTHDQALIATQVPFDDVDLQRSKLRFDAEVEARASLMAAGLTTLESVLALEAMPPSTARALMKGARVQYLEKPFLGDAAARAFFAEGSVSLDNLARKSPWFYTNMDETLLSKHFGSRPPSSQTLRALMDGFCGRTAAYDGPRCKQATTLAILKDPSFSQSVNSRYLQPGELGAISMYTNAPKGTVTATELPRLDSMYGLFVRLHSTISPLPLRTLFSRLSACLSAGDVNLKARCKQTESTILKTLGVGGEETPSQGTQFAEGLKLDGSG